mgnify:CR=1 FL=1
MASILSVPDVHGSHEWAVVKTLPKDSYDYIVFHGDYFDSWENEWPDQGENFKNICDFVREDTEHRKLLIGNHDWSYLSQSREGQNCSGHQSGSIYSEGKITVIRELLLGARDILELAFECDGWVFSHAGFSKTAVNYMQEILKNLGMIQDEKEYSISLLNSVFKKRLEEYDIFNFSKWIPFDEKLDWDGCFSGSGDEPSQFCLWIRPDSLLEDAYYNNQVVGHTEFCIYDKIYLQQEENKVIVVDSPDHEVYDVFDTQKEYEFFSVPEINKQRKKHFKVVNDIKSQLIMHNDTEDFIRKSLKEHFSDEVVEKLIKLAFKEYLE